MLLGTPAAGHLYAISPGTAFLVVGCLILVSTLVLLVPGVAGLFRRPTAHPLTDG